MPKIFSQSGKEVLLACLFSFKRRETLMCGFANEPFPNYDVDCRLSKETRRNVDGLVVEQTAPVIAVVAIIIFD